MDIGNLIKTKRIELGLTLVEVAEAVGVSDATVSRWESGDIENMRRDRIASLAEILRLNPLILLGLDDSNESVNSNQKIVDPINLKTDVLPVKRIPVLGSISAGNPLAVMDDVIGWVLYPDINSHEHFALYINGDSMDAAGLNDKDLVVVEVTPTVDNGSIAVVKVNGDDATVKKFYQNGNIIQLVPQSTNPEHQPQVYDLKDVQIDIVGRVVRITKDI